MKNDLRSATYARTRFEVIPQLRNNCFAPAVEITLERTMTTLGKSIVLGAFFAAICAVAALLNALPFHGSWQSLALWVASFACFGLLIGGVYAFDPASDLRIKSSAIGRIVFGLAAGALLSVLWRWPAEGAALAIVGGGFLAYLGMVWVKHVEGAL